MSQFCIKVSLSAQFEKEYKVSAQYTMDKTAASPAGDDDQQNALCWASLLSHKTMLLVQEMLQYSWNKISEATTECVISQEMLHDKLLHA